MTGYILVAKVDNRVKTNMLLNTFFLPLVRKLWHPGTIVYYKYENFPRTWKAKEST